MSNYLTDALDWSGLIERPRSSWASFTVGVLAGGIAGAAVAMMTAPTNGREMRHWIGRSAKRLSKRTQGLFADATVAVGDGIAHAPQLLVNGSDTVKGKVASQGALDGDRSRNV